MAITTFSAQERYTGGGGGTEPKKKLKKVRSVKVANLDRLRLSMREKSRFNSVMASVDDGTDQSESSTAGISETSSPNLANYMKDTTSSIARKGSLQASTGNIQSSDTRTAERHDNPASSSSKSASKFNKVPVQECSDPAGVHIPVIVKAEKSLKRVPSLKQSKKMTSKKSMKIRAKFSQFPGVGISEDEMLSYGDMEFQGDNEISGGGMEIDPESSYASSSHGQGSMAKVGVQKRGILERSRSRKLTRIRSIRSSKARQRLQSRFSNGATELMPLEAEVSNAEPHYMKGTSSQELKKNAEKGLTRTSSLRPFRVLAKIPSLRNKMRKARKRPQATSLSGARVDRATCSSVLKRAELPDGIELNPRSREVDGTASLHVCPYSYCSVHGHRHHTPSQPVKEFVSGKRKVGSNQKGEKTESRSREEVEHHHSIATETDHSRQTVSAENNAVQEVLNATTGSVIEAEDDGIDFLSKVYAKPRKKWATEAIHSEDAEALDVCTYDQISVGDYEEKLEETVSETSGSEESQGALNDDQQEIYESNKQKQNSNISALSLPSEHSHLTSRESAVSSGGDLVNIFSDKKKYTNMWQLIHQQLLSSEPSMSEAKEVNQADEKEGGDVNTCLEMNSFHPQQNEYNDHLSDDVGDQIAVTEKLKSHQTEAIKLVQEAVNAILQCDAESHYQQSNPVQEWGKSSLWERVSTPTASQEETSREDSKIDGKEMTLASAETTQGMQQIGEKLLQQKLDAQEKSGRQMSKSLSKIRKLFVTAKFIKAMERMKKINPRKPQYISTKPASENERVNLRHISMNEKKNTEEWMLDNALRQVISNLDPDQQRRVAQLVEAFETVAPEQEENSNKRHPMRSVIVPGDKLAIPTIEGKKQYVEPEQDVPLSYEQVVQQQDEILVSHKGVPHEQCFREEHEHQAMTTGDKILQKSNETNMPNSTLVLAETNFKSVCVDSAFDDGSTGNEEPKNTLEALPQFPTKNSEASLANDTTTIFFNKKKNKSMWNMIYKEVVSSEAAIIKTKRVNGVDEEHDDDKKNCQEMDDRDSISSDYGMEQDEHADDQSAANEKPDLDQSAAIKLVKEALGAILNRYEQQTNLQSITEHNGTSDDTRDLYIPTITSSKEENLIEEDKRVEKHTNSDVEDKLHQVENTSLPLQQQVESGESKAPQRKMSKSLSKLKKAIATTRFIKAMERLTKSSPRKSQNLNSNTTSEEERVYLRHRSIDGRKKGEEWMLDFALRQVISKMAPDQQRRVERLVEAYETVHPEQQEKGIPSYPLKGEPADKSELTIPSDETKKCHLKIQQQKPTSVEQIPQKKNDGSLAPTIGPSLERSLQEIQEDHDQQVNSSETTTRDASLERNVQEIHDQQPSVADDIILQETNETAISEPALISSGNDSKLPSVADKLEDPRTGDGETRKAPEFSSPVSIINSEVGQDGNMAAILFDKQNYTSMWHLIHQHVLSNEASTAGNQEVDEVDEDKQGDNANNCQVINDPESIQSTQLKNSKVDEDNQSAAFDQSDALNLVKDAINAILQCHEPRSDQRSLKDHSTAANNASDTTQAFTTENYDRNKMVNQINPEPEEKLSEVDATNAIFQQQAGAKIPPRKMSTGISKLKKAIVTAKFIKAMERLRKINPRKVRHLSAEVASEERVYLRHLSINERKNDEEWMLDYTLRKVLSSLTPEEQSKVALIVEAFETVNPRQKGLSSEAKNGRDPAIETEGTADKEQNIQSKQDNSTSNDEDIPPKYNDRFNSLNMLGKLVTVENSKQEYHSIEFSKHKKGMSGKFVESDDSNFHIDHQTSSKGPPNSNPLNKLTVKEEEEIGANPRHELLQHAKDSEQETKASITKGTLYGKQKNTSMWHLIYQHVESISAVETEKKLSERLTNEDQINSGDASAEMIADADSEDSDASSVTSELNESDATKLVREAINDILNAPDDLENDKASSNETTVSKGQRAAGEENPTKSLSKGYSKLRKLIICKKFIKAMEKTKKLNPQRQNSPALKSDSEAGNAHLKMRAVGVKKGMDERMLDNVLQKVIAELAPLQQRRVSMLVEAFEKVPDPEQRGKRVSYPATKFLDKTPSKEDPEEKEDIVSSKNARCPDGLGLKLSESTTSSREVITEMNPPESCKDKTSGLTKEYALDGENWRSDGPCNITATTSDAITNLSDTGKDPADTDGADASNVPLEERAYVRAEAGVQSEEGTSTEEQLAENTEKASKPPEPEDLKGVWNYSAHKTNSSERSTNLWGLILQQVTTDMLEKNDTKNTVEIGADAQRDSTKMLERRIDDSSLVSTKAKSCRDMGVQTPTSFEFQEDEAIKLVEEAVEEILSLQNQIGDTKSMTSSTTLDQEFYSPNSEDASDPSSATTETVDIAALPHTVATSEAEKPSSKESLTKSYSTLSKVIMCKRFVKAMDKMRKLKAQSSQNTSQPPNTEEKSMPSLRQTSSNDKASWEEGMLDNALQKVIGNLDPAKKKRVALLVQAFETVGSQPEPVNSSRGKASV